MGESKVFLFDNDEPEMQAAYQQARETFRYFWRELAWERRRIVPGLDLACVKTPFSDGKPKTKSGENPEVEQMWIGEVDFDGKTVTGELLNSPNWLKSVKAGDSASRTLDQITDWMYAIGGKVYGAYTVNLMRSRMSARERKEHDSAWGLDFGDPRKIRVVPDQKKSGGLLVSLFSKSEPAEIPEHPMSEAMGPSLKAELAKNPKMLTSKDDRGWTFLHQLALAGSAAGVKVLLDAGADPNTATDDGRTPLQLAKTLGWGNVAELLRGKGAKK